MADLFRDFFTLLLHLGAGGLYLLGVLDSSFLFLPLGNDVLVTALTVQHHGRLPLYAVVAALGSASGVFLLDLVCRKGGEAGLQKLVSKKRFEYLKRKMSQKAGYAVGIVTLAPPPFPFTPVVAGACAFGYPRWRLLAIVFVGRIIRFVIIGLLAIAFGSQIIRFTKTPVFLAAMIAIIVVSAIGSVLSILRWVRQSRGRGQKTAPAAAQS